MRALTLQQFKAACAVVDSGFNVSRAATSLHTTQSAVSKTIKALEDELGAAIFVRTSVRIAGLTQYGGEFIELARRILRDTEIAVMRAHEDASGIRGVLRIATTHMHARYTLAPAIRCFRECYPDVCLELDQSNAEEVARRVMARQVHLGITSLPKSVPAGLVALPAMQLECCIVVPVGHALLSVEKPSLHDIAKFNLITYSSMHPAGERLRSAFQRAGIEPVVAISANDASVIKELVAANLGIAVLCHVAVGNDDAGRLATINASHVLPHADVYLLLRHGEHLRTYTYRFMESFSPQWTQRDVNAALSEYVGSPDADRLSHRVTPNIQGSAATRSNTRIQTARTTAAAQR